MAKDLFPKQNFRLAAPPAPLYSHPNLITSLPHNQFLAIFSHIEWPIPARQELLVTMSLLIEGVGTIRLKNLGGELLD